MTTTQALDGRVKPGHGESWGLRLAVGQRYRTRGCAIAVIERRQAVEAVRPPADGFRHLLIGHVESEAHIPLAWFENGLYGARDDHPLTIVAVAP